jgi:MFS family permease
MGRKISATVITLSMVSLFTDMASEMLYPIMPLYLKEIGFSIMAIGILEGIAEAIAGLSKGYFGKISDQMGKRLPFVQVGYSLSALSKPMMALFTNMWWIFSARSIDRIGKGIRTGARDALLSDEATPETKGTVFGFHRSMDTLGAMLGPGFALLFLAYNPGNYKLLFYIAFIPGILAIITTLIIKEKQHVPKKTKTSWSFRNFFSYWNQSNGTYKKLVGALLLFALINSSDVFLLLKMKSAGVADSSLIGIYIFYNGIYALLAYPLGIFADKIGLKKMLIAGTFVFGITYAGFAAATSPLHFIVLFFLYGAYAAATEGIAKAWISNIVPSSETASAIGTYSGFQSIAALLASTIAGLVWSTTGAATLFIAAGGLSFVVLFFLTLVPTKTN